MLSSLSGAFSGTDGGSALDDFPEAETDKATGEETGRLKGVCQMRLLRTARWARRRTGKTIKGNRSTVMDCVRQQRTHFLLGEFLAILLCGVLVLSGPQETLSLLCGPEKNNSSLFIPAKPFC